MEIEEILSKYITPTKDCIDDVKDHYEEFYVDRNRDIVKQGEVNEYIYFIAEGTVRIGLLKDNKEDTVCFGGDGDVFISMHSYWCKEPAAYRLFAIENCRGWKISFCDWNNLESRHPELVHWMRMLLVEQLYSFERLYRSFALTTPEQRLYNFWEKSPSTLRNVSPASLSRVVPLKFIAQYLGMAQQTLSVLRRKFVGK